jgi:hypothetical protein
VSEEQSSGALQLAAQVNFRLDKGQACAEAYDKLKAAGEVRVLWMCCCDVLCWVCLFVHVALVCTATPEAEGWRSKAGGVSRRNS